MKSFCFGIFTVLAVFAGSAFSKSTNEEFYNLFKDNAPLPKILEAIFDNDCATQLQHLQAIQQHIESNDEYAERAKQLKQAAQNILDANLVSIGFHHVDIDEFIQAAAKKLAGETIEDAELEKAIEQLEQRKKEISESSDDNKKIKLGEMIQKAGRKHHKHSHSNHRRVVSTAPPTSAPYEPVSNDASAPEKTSDE